MKKVLLAFAVMLTLVSARAWGVCHSDADCRPGGVGTDVCLCAAGATPPAASPNQCGTTTVIPGVLEISGATSSAGAAGCIEIAETVGIGGSPSSPIVAPVVGTEADCDAAATAACLSGGCGACYPAGTEE